MTQQPEAAEKSALEDGRSTTSSMSTEAPSDVAQSEGWAMVRPRRRAGQGASAAEGRERVPVPGACGAARRLAAPGKVQAPFSESAFAARRLVLACKTDRSAPQVMQSLQHLGELACEVDVDTQFLVLELACELISHGRGPQNLQVAESAAVLAERLLPSVVTQNRPMMVRLCQDVCRANGLIGGLKGGVDQERCHFWLLRLRCFELARVPGGALLAGPQSCTRLAHELYAAYTTGGGELARAVVLTTDHLLSRLQGETCHQLSCAIASEALKPATNGGPAALGRSQLRWLRAVGLAGSCGWRGMWGDSRADHATLLAPLLQPTGNAANELLRFECLAGLLGCIKLPVARSIVCFRGGPEDMGSPEMVCKSAARLVHRLCGGLVAVAAACSEAPPLWRLTALHASGKHAPLPEGLRAEVPSVLVSALGGDVTRVRAAEVLASSMGDFGLDEAVAKRLAELLQDWVAASELLPILLEGLQSSRLFAMAPAVLVSALDHQGMGDRLLEQALDVLCDMRNDFSSTQVLVERIRDLLKDAARPGSLLPLLIKRMRCGHKQQLAPLRHDVLLAGLHSEAVISDTLALISALGAEAEAEPQNPAIVARLMDLLDDALYRRGALRALFWGRLGGQALKKLCGRSKAMIAEGGRVFLDACDVLRWVPFERGLRHLFEPKVEAALRQSDSPAAWHCLAQCVLHSKVEIRQASCATLLKALVTRIDSEEEQEEGGWEPDTLQALACLVGSFPEPIASAVGVELESLERWRRLRACRLLWHVDPATIMSSLRLLVVPLVSVSAGALGQDSEAAASIVTKLVCSVPCAKLLALEGFCWEKALRAACVDLQAKVSSDAMISDRTTVHLALEALATAQRQLLLRADGLQWKGIMRSVRPTLLRLAAVEGLSRDLTKTVSALLQDTKGGAARLCARCTDRPRECLRCKGKAFDVCFGCEGKGMIVRKAWCGCWTRRRAMPEPNCPLCSGSGQLDRQEECRRCQGLGRWPCGRCHGEGRPFCKECNKAASTAEPAEGLRITPASPAELTQLQKLWTDRGGQGCLAEAWSLDNPKLSWIYNRRRLELSEQLAKDPDELEGFHGSLQANFLSIMTHGFDASRRCGQVYGAGEYFAKNPEVSRAYCRGGDYMLVCRLLLGIAGSTEGDHIWVPSMCYYVISQPTQVLPLFLVRFAHNAQPCPKLQAALSGSFDTVAERQPRGVPPNRPCAMSAESTDRLWIGYLQPGWSDADLHRAVHDFLRRNLPGAPPADIQVQVVRGKFTQAKARLARPVARQEVLRLNEAPFQEDGRQRTLTVDDAHGSPGQKCARSIARYCRGRNLRFVDPCNCSHGPLPTDGAVWELQPLTLGGAKADEITGKFLASMQGAKVLAISAVKNDTLLALHEHYRSYVREKNGTEPKCIELYHGTNNRILETVYTHGLFPPSDMKASDACPVSGGKGLCTSLCNNSCEYCTERHEWCKCHMFGLGMYLADSAEKSNRYVSMPAASGRRRMVVCSVVAGSILQMSGHLRSPAAMHDVFSLRSLWNGDLARLVEFEGPPPPLDGMEHQDLLMVPGLGPKCRPGFSVYNTEYVAFHPYQVMPRYEITYTL